MGNLTLVRKFLTYPLVLDWLQWCEFPHSQDNIDYPKVALELLAEYRAEIKRLEEIESKYNELYK